ncbi:MAG TPA: hypothetical protein HA254_01805 [Candidatus Diapherotrites archaeon]|uniref:Cadherin domain-containing protein n=1 Tax=Candidatus Iainarchaeum sp. TaxID=3101447 RepID=A0A7J4IVA5_9ARCH|nr:hypothetical protein [Candidatus Diapherotrites archaeon]
MDVRKGYPVSLVICNASSVTWQPQNVSLVQANNVNWGTEAKTIPLDSPLSPGKAKLLTFNVTSPSKPGSYPATWSFRYNYNGNLFGASCGNPKVNVSVLPNKPPAFVGIPGITLQMNSEGGLELIDLYEYLSDDKIANESLTLSVSNQTDSSLIDCFINSDNRHLACYPPATGRTGTNQLTLTAIDNGGLVGTYYANVNVAEPDPTGDNSPPEIRAIEPITINIDASADNELIDLWEYATDDHNEPENLAYDFQTTPTSIITCIIANNRFFTCQTPTAAGVQNFNFIVTDSSGLSSTEAFTLTVVDGTTPQNNPPAISGLPDIDFVLGGQPNQSSIDLHNYTLDLDEPDEELFFNIEPDASTIVSCELASNRYVNCTNPLQTGTDTFTVIVTDSNGASAQDTFSVTVRANGTNAAPVIASIPDADINQGNGNRRVVNLYDYVSDDHDQDGQLVFSPITQNNSSIINCFLDSGQFIYCGTASTSGAGINTLSFTVTDRNGLSGTGQMRVNVIVPQPGNTGPVLSVPDRQILTGSQNQQVADLWAYESDDHDSDGALQYTIQSQSNTAVVFCEITQNRHVECDTRSSGTGSSTIVVEARDSGGLSGTDPFVVTVTDNPSGVCSDIELSSSARYYMSENSGMTVGIDIANESAQEFEITSVQVTDDSQYLTIGGANYGQFIGADESGSIDIEIDSENVSTQRDATVNVKVRGHFTGGNSCNLNDITRSFAVTIYNDNGSGNGGNPVCDDITIETSSFTVNENSTATRTLTLRNGSERTFTVNSLSVVENSSRLSVSVNSKPGTIAANNDADAILRIQAFSVGSTTTDDAQISVAGRFSNGATCSLSSIRRDVPITVTNNGGSGNGNSGSVELSISSSALSVQSGQSITTQAVIRNNTGSRQCFDVTTSGNSVFSVTPSSQSVCIENGGSSTLSFVVQGDSEGTSSITIRAQYGSTTISESVSVNVSSGSTFGQQASPQISASTDSANSRAILQNIGNDLTNVELTMSGLPASVQVKPVYKEVWKKNESIELEPLNGSFDGNFSALLRVESDQGVRSIPLIINAATGQQGPSGLVSLVTTLGTALGLLIVVILAIIGILSVARK